MWGFQTSISPRGIWCNALLVIQLQFTLLNKIYVNHDVKELSLLILSLNVSLRYIIEKTQWLTSKFKMIDGRLLDLKKWPPLRRTHLSVGNGGREFFIVIVTYEEFLGWFSCLFSSPHKGKTVPAIFLTVLSVGIIVPQSLPFYMLQMVSHSYGKFKIHPSSPNGCLILWILTIS